jgi:ribose-phosphate pyrophosphokinase
MIKLNDIELEFITFPNGETKVNGEQIHKLIKTTLIRANDYVTLKYEDDKDLIRLMFVKKYLDEINIHVNLKILYMPYSRMDRVEGQSVFTLKYVSQFINSLNFAKVDIFEPHSDVTCALVDKNKSIYSTIDLLPRVIKETNFDIEKDYIYFPDNGAEKRYSKNIKFKNQLVGIKHRNFETGKIERLQVVGDIKEKGFKAIIIDDLCSYGGTFIMGAEKLRELGATEIYLLVTHCEESIYKGEILKTDLIDKVFTTDSILKETNNKKITMYNL